ncbi:MAG: fibronectin type III domain-containing protein [Gemmatimonadaceae bacterium]|nr:fibronectin type III domain-containing protein [Gemmatimonadaceae bacterium]
MTVNNVNEAGRITLSPSTPMTCAHVNATLEDVDGGITTEASASPPSSPRFIYGWEWVPPSAGPSGSSGTSTTRSYLPANPSVGQTVRVTVQYGDRASDRNTATLTSGAVTANTPRTPTGLKSTGGDRRVSLSWKAPDNCGSTITGYRYWYRKKSQTAWEDSGGAPGPSVSVPGLDNDVPYRFEIRAVNGQGRSLAAGIDGTPVPCVLSLSGSADVEYTENGTGPVGTYTVTRSSSCDASLTLTWSRAGTNASAFKLTGTGSSRSLRFNSAPNYEAKSSYSVTVQVTDGSASASRPVTVNVTNADDRGVVTLDASRPKVGEHVTATLTDEDGGITGPTWSWSTESGAAGQASSVQSYRYTVPASDVGKRLQASVSYTDNHGSGKSASGRSGVVRANTPKPPPDFRAVRGNGQVALSWGAADGRGAAVDRYDIRGAGSGWTAVPGAGSARDTTVTGLTNGTSYAFEVRGHNGAGHGAASRASATPATVPGAPTNLATDRQGGNGFMELTWGAAPANGSPIQHYYYRYKKTGDDDWRGWYRRAGGANARSKSWNNFDDGASYVFQVRARNPVGYGTTAQVSASALGPGGSNDEDEAGGHEETEDELMPEGEVPEPGEDEVVVVAKPVAEGPAGWLAAADSLAVRSAPNPFNPSTTLHFQLPEAGPVTLTVYNVASQVVAELVHGEILDAGLHAREWYGTDEHGRPLASGLYLFRLIAGGQVLTGKLALIR